MVFGKSSSHPFLKENKPTFIRTCFGPRGEELSESENKNEMSQYKFRAKALILKKDQF